MYYEDERPDYPDYYRENPETGELEYYHSYAGLYYPIEEVKPKKRSYEEILEEQQ